MSKCIAIKKSDKLVCGLTLKDGICYRHKSTIQKKNDIINIVSEVTPIMSPTASINNYQTDTHTYYLPEIQVDQKIINDDDSDDDNDILSDDTYISDDEEEVEYDYHKTSIKPLIVEDDCCNDQYDFNEGYESENDGYLSDDNGYEEDDKINDKSDTAFMQSIIQKQLEQEQKEQEIARKARWLEEERLNAIESHQKAIDAIAERKALQQAEIEAKTLAIAEAVANTVTITDDEGVITTHDKWDEVIFPSDNHELDINRVWSDQEIHSMRDNNWYKLCSLLPKKFWIDIDYQMRIIYAFKREISLNDSQRYWMIVDLYNSIVNYSMSEKAMVRLANDIRMKKNTNPDEYEDMHTTWVDIKKLIKSNNTLGFALWEKARKQEARQTKTIETKSNSDDTGLNSFIAGVALGTYKASVLYGMYLTKDPSDVLTVQKFGKALNSRGLKSKRIKINKVAENCYVLTQESVSAFLNHS